MTEQQWRHDRESVTDAMLEHTKQFVTPLSTETATSIRLVGTGSYVQHEKRMLITCEHVARVQPMHYRFLDSTNVFAPNGNWTMDEHPIDAAFVPISDSDWEACTHNAAAVPYSRFAKSHAIVERAELLFFRGYSGENAHYGFNEHLTNGSGYCSQVKDVAENAQFFEIFWEPKHTQFTKGTSAEACAAVKFEDPAGFSGSLVWNTRFLEVSRQNRKWAPKDAVVTGLLRRWDSDTKSLLVWRVEHLRAWLKAAKNWDTQNL